MRTGLKEDDLNDSLEDQIREVLSDEDDVRLPKAASARKSTFKRKGKGKKASFAPHTTKNKARGGDSGAEDFGDAAEDKD